MPSMGATSSSPLLPPLQGTNVRVHVSTLGMRLQRRRGAVAEREPTTTWLELLRLLTNRALKVQVLVGSVAVLVDAKSKGPSNGTARDIDKLLKKVRAAVLGWGRC